MTDDRDERIFESPDMARTRLRKEWASRRATAALRDLFCAPRTEVCRKDTAPEAAPEASPEADTSAGAKGAALPIGKAPDHAISGDTGATPIEIAIRGPRIAADTVLSLLGEIRAWNEAWDAAFRGGAGERGAGESGATVCWRDRTMRLVGSVRTPRAVVFSDAAAIARWIGRAEAAAFALAVARIGRLADLDPRLGEAMPGLWREIVALDECDMGGFLRLLAWRRDNPDLVCAVREIPVKGLHTKWVEGHVALVGRALDALDLLRPINSAGLTGAAAALARIGFLRESAQTIDMRFHPEDFSLPFAGSRLALPPSEMTARPQGIDRVLVIENRTTYLGLAPARGVLVMLGDGAAAISALAAIDWLDAVDLAYWGDCDGAGYWILDRVRASRPAARSIMMDMKTVSACRAMCVPEPSAAGVSGALGRLTLDEACAREAIAAAGLRLEQERIPAALLDLADFTEAPGASFADHMASHPVDHPASHPADHPADDAGSAPPPGRHAREAQSSILSTMQ